MCEWQELSRLILGPVYAHGMSCSVTTCAGSSTVTQSASCPQSGRHALASKCSHVLDAAADVLYGVAVAVAAFEAASGLLHRTYSRTPCSEGLSCVDTIPAPQPPTPSGPCCANL